MEWLWRLFFVHISFISLCLSASHFAVSIHLWTLCSDLYVRGKATTTNNEQHHQNSKMLHRQNLISLMKKQNTHTHKQQLWIYRKWEWFVFRYGANAKAFLVCVCTPLTNQNIESPHKKSFHIFLFSGGSFCPCNLIGSLGLLRTSLFSEPPTPPTQKKHFIKEHGNGSHFGKFLF